MSHGELRQFIYGIVVGITMVIGCFTSISYVVGIKWQPVPWNTEASQIPD